jgi:ABC-2 type transport system permease protein
VIRFVLLLLGARLRLLYNSFRRGKPAARVGWILAALALAGGAFFSGFAGWGVTRLLALLQQPDIQEALRAANYPLGSLQPEALLSSVLSVLVLAVWGIILLSSLGAALNNFYLASDLDLLVAAPIPMRAIFTAKFLEGLGVGYLLLFMLGGPALIGLGIGAGYPWLYFLGAALVLLLLPLVPESLGTLLIMPLVRVIPPKRLREVLQVLGGLVGVAFYFFSQLPRGNEMDPQTAGQVVQVLQSLHLPFLPQGWAAQGLVGLGQGNYLSAAIALGAFALLSVGLYALALVGAERLYYSGWASMQSAPAARRHRTQRAARPEGELPFLPRPVQGILTKDLRLFLRDPQGWTQMLMPLAFYALFLIQATRKESPWGPGGSAAATLLGGAFALFMAVSMTSGLSLGGVGREGKQMWLLQTAPVTPRRILWGKFLSAFLPLLGLGGAMLLGLTVVSGGNWPTFLGSWLFLGLIGLGTTGIAVGLGASFPRLDAERNKQRVSPGAGCLYFPLIMAYMGVVSGLILLPPMFSDVLSKIDLSVLAWILWAIGPLGAIVLTGLAVWLPLRIGAARLAALEV